MPAARKKIAQGASHGSACQPARGANPQFVLDAANWTPDFEESRFPRSPLLSAYRNVPFQEFRWRRRSPTITTRRADASAPFSPYAGVGNFRVLLNCLLAMKRDDFSKTAALCRKLAPPPRNPRWPCRAIALINWRSAAPGGFIEDLPVLPGRVGDPSNEVLRFFEARARHHDDVDWIAHIAQRPAESGRCDHGYWRAPAPPRGSRPKQDDPLRTRHRKDAPNNCKVIPGCIRISASSARHSQSNPPPAPRATAQFRSNLCSATARYWKNECSSDAISGT